MSEASAGAGTHQTYLEVRGLLKRFGSFTALRDVDLDVHEGEFVCFLGPSGCGKTTLLRAIAGLDIQTSGVIRQAGRDISALPPSERDFGIVFQSYALFPNLSVMRNVAYGLENRGQPRAAITTRVRELLALVGLPEQEHKYPAQLSGGQQQRVALARALATSPGLLLLDEPLSALDARVRVHLRHEIRGLQKRLGVTTIMVNHDQEEALTMADRIVVMNQGVIEQVGTPVEIYRDPATPFVADFVGTMNFVGGESLGDGRIRVGDAEFHCDRTTPVAGTRVSLCIRPEDVAVREVDVAAGNALSALIADMEFLGSTYRATLQCDAFGDTPLLADFSVNAVRDLELDTGREVPVALPASRLRVFARAEPA